MKSRLPSAKALDELVKNSNADDTIDGAVLRAILATDATVDKKIAFVDTLLRTHGVESFETKKARYSYCNTGDTYALTLIRDHTRRRWLVTDYGSIVEAEDR